MLTIVALALAALPSLHGAPSPAPDAVRRCVRQLHVDRSVQAEFAYLREREPRTREDQRTITGIPAPSLDEGERAAHLERRLRDVGVTDVSRDEAGNVIGRLPGVGRGPTVALAAHLDTVFPRHVDLAIREAEGRLLAPGIGDNSRGLGALIAVAESLTRLRLRTAGDILLIGTVGEEGLGDLKGVRALFRDPRRIDAFVAIDGAGSGNITASAVGSRRLEVTFDGPGGHSFADFGRPSANGALGRAVAQIYDLRLAPDARTTFNVGVVTGGTAVNAIAAQARMQIDLRSATAADLGALERQVRAIVTAAAQAENRRWASTQIEATIRTVGDRPPGANPAGAPIVEAAREAVRLLTGREAVLTSESTDANIPMSLGIPAIAVEGGGAGGSLHSTDEWFDPADAEIGPQTILLITLALAGTPDVCGPMIAERPRPAAGPGR